LLESAGFCGVEFRATVLAEVLEGGRTAGVAVSRARELLTAART
jgi:hypothetical protein